MSRDEDSGEASQPQVQGPAAPGGAGAANPMALTVQQVARMLALPEEKVREHVARGLPMSADGRINLVQYAAWLNKELSRGD